jgi:hypothetical protein
MVVGRVSLKKALALLDASGDKVSQSALSRYVAKYSDALQPERVDGQTLVDFEKLSAHRAQNLHGAATASTENAPFAANRPNAEGSRGRAEEAALNIRAQRLMREVALAKVTGELTPRREVEEAAMAAVSALKSALALALTDTASALARAIGVEAHVVRPHLRNFETKALEAFARALAERGLANGEVAPAE